MKRIIRLLFMAAILVIAAYFPIHAASGSRTISTCPMFPADNVWNTSINNLPISPNSANWVNSIGSATGLHMDFGSGTWNGGPIGIPYNLADGTTPRYTVSFLYADESDPGPYPIPASPSIEYSSDHHLLVVDGSTCHLYELYAAHQRTDGSWSAGSGAIWDLNSDALRPAGWTSADAAGLPILPGLVRYDEVAAGQISHAIRFTASSTNGYTWPARHLTSGTPGVINSTPPMGARFRLKASFDISGYPAQSQVILQAMKTYGIILADNGSDWYISGAPDPRWDNDVLHQLDNITGDDFEAVNSANLIISPDSGATALTAIFASEATQDGKLLESSETSSQGGTMNAIAATFDLGDNLANKQFRGILSFDTAGLPDTAVIKSVTLKIRKAALVGSNPFHTMGKIVADIKNGSFSEDPTLQLGDFQAAASKNAVLTFSNTPVSGWYSKKLSSINFSYINLAGITQFRLRFSQDDNNNHVADYLKFYSGNASAVNQPTLIITYYVP